MHLIIVSGRSGSGKSVVLHALEDLGYYCIDNLPLNFLSELVEKPDAQFQHIAISIDARNLTNFFEDFEQTYRPLKEKCHSEIIYIDADENTLLKRFSETRRKHPLTNKGISLKEALKTEQKLLEPILDYADLTIDTSHLNVRELFEIIHKRLQHKEDELSILFQSFGYKHGIPQDSNFIFDTRCLPNPYWNKAIWKFSGRDPEIIEYLEKFSQVQEMYDMIKNFIEEWIPHFKTENRRYLTISIGCTGGHHRSVYFAEKLGHYFGEKFKDVTIQHRDL